MWNLMLRSKKFIHGNNIGTQIEDIQANVQVNIYKYVIWEIDNSWCGLDINFIKDAESIQIRSQKIELIEILGQTSGIQYCVWEVTQVLPHWWRLPCCGDGILN